MSQIPIDMQADNAVMTSVRELRTVVLTYTYEERDTGIDVAAWLRGDADTEECTVDRDRDERVWDYRGSRAGTDYHVVVRYPLHRSPAK